MKNPSEYSVGELRHRNKSILKSSTPSKSHDSSDESSILSGMNLGGSVPFDLPGTVEAEHSFSNPLVMDHNRGSALSLQDIDISVNHPPQTVDVAVQCTPEGSSITHYHSPCSSPPRRTANSEHSRRLHSVNPSRVYSSPSHTQSMPNTPIKTRKMTLHESYCSHVNYNGGGGGGSSASGASSPPLPMFRNQALSNGSRDMLEERKALLKFNNVMSSDSHITEVRGTGM